MYSLREQIYWIYLPKAIDILGSENGKDYHPLTSVQHAEIESIFAKDKMIHLTLQNATARYLKIKFTCADEIAKEKPGAGNKPWLFLSEIVVD
ncbi:MAG: hypothetical protein IPI46_11305 [Bacteroidetes bacterium]|nr:hypothetical protein [Bacteroidota bacterium]